MGNVLERKQEQDGVGEKTSEEENPSKPTAALLQQSRKPNTTNLRYIRHGQRQATPMAACCRKMRGKSMLFHAAAPLPATLPPDRTSCCRDSRFCSKDRNPAALDTRSGRRKETASKRRIYAFECTWLQYMLPLTFGITRDSWLARQTAA